MNIKAYNFNTRVKLLNAVTPAATSVTLVAGDGAKLPALSAGEGFYLTLTDAATRSLSEIVLVTAKTGDVLTVVRAVESSLQGGIAQNWLANDFGENRITAGTVKSLYDSMQDIAVTPIMFGAIGNSGSYDDSVALNACFASVFRNITLAGKSYGTTATLVSSAARRVINGDGGIISAMTSNMLILHILNAQMTTVRDLSINGAGLAAEGIRVTTSTITTIDSCKIYALGSTATPARGINCIDANELRITDNMLYNLSASAAQSSTGIRVYGSVAALYNTIISRNNIYNFPALATVASTGIELTYSGNLTSYATIRDNHVSDCTNYGYKCAASDYNILNNIYTNTLPATALSSAVAGFSVTGANVNIINNIFTNSLAMAGIEALTTNNITIKSNIVNASTSNKCINISTCNDIVIENNTLREGNSCITATGCAGFVAKGNTFSGGSMLNADMTISASCSSVAILDNIATAGNRGGMLINSSPNALVSGVYNLRNVGYAVAPSATATGSQYNDIYNNATATPAVQGTATGQTFFNVDNGLGVNTGQGAKVFFSTVIPSAAFPAGVFSVGDIAFNSAPVTGALKYWRCTTAPNIWEIVL